MKVTVAAGCLLLLFLFLTASPTLGSEVILSPRGPHQAERCCISFVNRPVPRNRITGYYETSGLCPKAGVIFRTIKGRSICASPHEVWVQNYIKELEE